MKYVFWCFLFFFFITTPALALEYENGVPQAPLVAGTDYLAPNGDGSGLSGVVTSETDPNWPRQANCDTIIGGCCMDTDNGYLYCWDGDSVEEVGRPGSVDTLTFSAAGFVGSDGAGNFDDYYLDSGNFENTTGTWGIKANGVSSAEIATIVQSIAWNAAGTSSDGTQCADPTEATINSGPITYTTICADNDASTIYGHVVMPDSWDGGTVTMESEYLQTAADTGALNGDIACMCRGAGETINNTWGTEIAIDDAAVTGSNAVDHTTSAAMTCDGTCAAGDTLYWRYQMDATGTTTAVATLHFIGWKMEYTSNVGD